MWFLCRPTKLLCTCPIGATIGHNKLLSIMLDVVLINLQSPQINGMITIASSVDSHQSVFTSHHHQQQLLWITVETVPLDHPNHPPQWLMPSNLRVYYHGFGLSNSILYMFRFAFHMLFYYFSPSPQRCSYNSIFMSSFALRNSYKFIRLIVRWSCGLKLFGVAVVGVLIVFSIEIVNLLKHSPITIHVQETICELHIVKSKSKTTESISYDSFRSKACKQASLQPKN